MKSAKIAVSGLDRWLLISVVLLLLTWAAIAKAQQIPGCGSLQNSFGPFDYRDPAARGEPLRLVESAHFGPSVESLTKGQTGAVIGDLDYTLRAFPNHHRALNSVAKYELRGGNAWINPAVRSAQCYFERAIAFRGDDQVVRMLYANFLVKSGRTTEGRAQYEEALRISPNDAEVNYNAGLFFVSQGEIDRAKKHAAVAYAAGYPLPGLRKKLAEAEARQAP
jgi:predicted Zn-dependent protease